MCFAMSYAVSAFIEFYTRSEYSILEQKLHNEISTYDTFGKKDNFVIAAGYSGTDRL